jgi:hypothetical protein
VAGATGALPWLPIGVLVSWENVAALVLVEDHRVIALGAGSEKRQRDVPIRDAGEGHRIAS